MENLEPKKEKNKLEELEEMIINAPKEIEKEFAETGNSWLACFTNSVDAIETYLWSPRVAGLLSHEQHQRASERLEELKREVYDLKKQYPERKTTPPDEIKKELLGKLDILGGV